VLVFQQPASSITTDTFLVQVEKVRHMSTMATSSIARLDDVHLPSCVLILMPYSDTGRRSSTRAEGLAR